MRILITNDDSISSAVLLPLAKWAKQFGEVTVVVPKYEQSGKSHCIEFKKAFEVKQVPLTLLISKPTRWILLRQTASASLWKACKRHSILLSPALTGA